MQELAKLEKILKAIADEYYRSKNMHGPILNSHHGIGVMLEEVDELKAEVWKKKTFRDRDKMYEEAVHVANTAVRFMMDICLRSEK